MFILKEFITETNPIYLFDDGDKNRNGDNLVDEIFSRI
jgi:hypothetical protein